MAYLREGNGTDDPGIGSGGLSTCLLRPLRWVAIPCAVVAFASWSAATLAGYHTATSLASNGSFLHTRLPVPQTIREAAPMKARLVPSIGDRKSERLAVDTATPAKPVERPAATTPVDPFGKVVAEAKLSREKFLAAFASAGMTISEPNTAEPVRLASALPIAERFHHAAGQPVFSDGALAADPSAPDPLSSLALGQTGLPDDLTYAAPDASPDNPVQLALATLPDDPLGLDSGVEIEVEVEGMPDSVELPLAKPAAKPAKPAREPAVVASKPAKPQREPAIVAEKPAAPARKPTRSDAQEPQQTLAYAKPDKPGIGAFKNLFDTPKAGKGVAIYDISAAVVHMPDGSKLEAHSGIGKMADNPRYVHVKMNGPTPPNTYKLSMREKRFHGVEAVRMTPVGDQTMHGRDGILAHSYLLRGGRAESHGCVAFKDYQRFLKAFKQGKVTHIIVVPSMSKMPKVRLASMGRGA